MPETPQQRWVRVVGGVMGVIEACKPDGTMGTVDRVEAHLARLRAADRRVATRFLAATAVHCHHYHQPRHQGIPDEEAMQ